MQDPGLHYYSEWYCTEGNQGPPSAVEPIIIIIIIIIVVVVVVVVVIIIIIVYGIFHFPVALVCQVL
jgi:hypothetical protein